MLAHFSPQLAHLSPKLAHLSPELAPLSFKWAHLSLQLAHMSPKYPLILLSEKVLFEMVGDELGTSIFFTYFSWLTSTSEGGESKISAILSLSLLSDQNHHHEGCLYRAVTSKKIKLEIPARLGFEGLEKLFPTVMCFFYLKFFLVVISLLEA